MNKNEIKKDVQAFADDEGSIIIDPSGNVMFSRNGQDIFFRVFTDNDKTMVEYNEKTYVYRDFFSREIARLDLLAARLVEKRRNSNIFIDAPSVLKMASKERADTCMTLLKLECDEFYQFSTKVTFITADAGHGKTALLKQFQVDQAERFLKGESKFIFWHIDLQGRELVRLPEAIMYDLAELRISGLFYSSILFLIRNKFIILAIDGFDELAAEIGGVSALGALSSLVLEMDGQGTLIAASRRTFFDTNDYLKRTKFLKAKLSPECEFNELKLCNWGKDDVTGYIGYFFDNAESIYEDIKQELHNDSFHPIITRPFLLAKTIEALYESKISPADFFGMANNAEEGVAIIVEAFTKREVNKWKEWDQQTGKPYLTFDQHMILLSAIAREMWESHKDNILKEEIQFLTTILLDEWEIDDSVKPKIIRLVESHAFLIPVSDSNADLRKFEHEEFKNYFLSRALAIALNNSLASGKFSDVRKLLFINQLPDAVARYCFNYVNDFQNVSNGILQMFKLILDGEWKPSYLQQNFGTLIPAILDRRESLENIIVDLKVSYSSLIFENKKLSNISFINGDFINISLRDTSMNSVTFDTCRFNELKFDLDSELSFKNVILEKSEITSVSLMKNNDVIECAFSPIRIEQILQELGIKIHNGEQRELANTGESEFKKLVDKFLLRFNKTIYQFEKNILNDKEYGQLSENIIEQVIPLLTEYDIIEEKETKQSKQTGTRAWVRKMDFQEIYYFDGIKSDNKLTNFWHRVRSTNIE